MKRRIALVLVAVLLLSVIGCARNKKPKGVYTNGSYMTIEFTGNTVTLRVGMGNENDTISKGTFEVNENEIICSFEDGGSDTFIYDYEKDSLDWMGIIQLEKQS